ncbi:fimbria/pilus outer membrane usher protein [Chromobacterium amazonense]|uniref:Fimbria/pilus outer membrane usher protein n=1 Tax=Chromobacterium amazonense TaxID=1382803 RepID=A0ABU8UYZ0_9NEIS|nr:fimbria/pilus outer membrane usher protein [Chromobacterium amazonense]MDQ4540971.1 fimbria/pilus outer membrane usher protein [Chromobacterium amazonense]
MRVFRKKKISVAVASATLFLTVSQACHANDEAQRGAADAAPSAKGGGFDAEALRARGLDPALASLFNDKARFLPGRQEITLLRNGSSLGNAMARFNDDGSLCFDEALLERAGLQLPDGPDGWLDEDGMPACLDFIGAWPQTQVELDPNANQVALLVPTAALRAMAREQLAVDSGGGAALLNYVLNASRASGNGYNNQYFSAEAEFGFNLGDWVVRSNQLYARSDGKSSSSNMGTYAQRTFAEQGAQLRVGAVGVNSPLFAVGGILGAQLQPEPALNQHRGGPVVDGIAQSVARVEVRQFGRLIHTTQVPPGPFALQDIPLQNGNGNLEVKLVEADGSERTWEVLASTFAHHEAPTLGYALAAGKLQDMGVEGVDNDPWVVTASGSWQLWDKVQGTVAGLVSADYQALGYSLNAKPTKDISFSLSNVVARSGGVDELGHRTMMSLDAALNDTVSAGASAAYQSEGYRDLYAAARNRADGVAAYVNSDTQTEYSVYVSWQQERLGSVQASYSASRSYGGTSSSQASVGWSQNFKSFSANLMATRDIRGGSGNAVYLNLSIPLDKRRVGASMSSSGGKTTVSATLSETVNDRFAYNVRASRDNRGDNGRLYGNINYQSVYTSVAMGVGQNGQTRQAYGTLSGGLVANSGGVTASPQKVDDTFGVLSVGGVKDIRVATPGGSVWTDGSGKAVIPSLRAYEHNEVKVDVTTLPMNVELRNGLKELKVGRGAVVEVAFDVMKTRRVLLEIKDENGNLIPKGASVLGPDFQFVSSAVDAGKVFLESADYPEYKVSMGSNSPCTFALDLPETAPTDVFYEQVSVVCKAG